MAGSSSGRLAGARGPGKAATSRPGWQLALGEHGHGVPGRWRVPGGSDQGRSRPATVHNESPAYHPQGQLGTGPRSPLLILSSSVPEASLTRAMQPPPICT